MAKPEEEKWRHPKFKEFHLEMGYCVSAWALVDEVLFSIFQRCVGPWHQCAIIYYRTPGLDIRRGLVDEIVRFILPKPEKNEHPHEDVKAWAAATRGLNDLLATRRRIAHQQVGVTLYADERPQSPNYNPVMEVFASHYERLRGKDEGGRGIDIERLAQHQADVQLLADRLAAFRDNVLEKYAAKLPPLVPPPWSTKS
jgi:hypothetical protein